MTGSRAQSDIAIVGMAATYAGAPDLATFWDNILGKVDAVSEAAPEWIGPHYDPDSKDNDRIYTRKGGFLKELADFDPTEFGIMPSAVDGGEPDQYLALKLARQALRDAGYLDKSFDRQRTGIILGRGTYVNRGYTNLMQHGMMVDQTLELLRQVCPDLEPETLARVRSGLKAKLPPFTAEMSPGLVPNVVTGRIANRLDLMGPNFIVDAACASSLVAVEMAMKELHSGRCDMVLAGGVHASTPPQIYMIFCQLGAMSRSNIRPFDVEANGTLLGEGLGILVLKRLADAERDGDRIYAVLKSVGVASDGKALGLLAPRLEGEVLAVERAYAQCGIDPQTVGLLEAHGTGIALGDQTEVKALGTVFGRRRHGVPNVALGSVKSMISHCIPAAGIAGIIKAALAIHHKVLPPTLCHNVNPALGIEQTPFYVNNEARPWVHGDDRHGRRAGVNAFGFGGINAHAVLEEYRGAAAVNAEPVAGRWPTELVALAADDRAGLLQRLNALMAAARNGEDVRLADLGYSASRQLSGNCRLALTAGDVDDFLKKAESARAKIAGGSGAFQTRSGVFYRETPVGGKVAFLFPGEGAQYPNMLADLCLCFPPVRRWFDFLDRAFAGERDYAPSAAIFPPPTSLTKEQRRQLEDRLYGMDLASESVFVAAMGIHQLLSRFGVRADAMVGHSTGENAALIAAGAVRFDDDGNLAAAMRQLNGIYQRLEQGNRIPRGVLLTVGGADRNAVQAVVDQSGGQLVVAMDNCPNQVVLFGPAGAMESAQQQLAGQGAICMRLPFDRGYHTPSFEAVGTAFRQFYDSLDVAAPHTPLYSCATAAPFPDDAAGIRHLAEHQWSTQVRFRDTVEKLYEEGFRVFVEVGPSGNLTSFVEDTLRGRDCLALASNSRRKPGLLQFQQTLARWFTAGMALDVSPMYAGRAVRDLLNEGAAKPAKPRKPLNLHMPLLRVSDEEAAALRDELSRALAAHRYAEKDHVPSAAPQSATRTDLTQPTDGAARGAPVPVPDPAQPADPRVAAVAQHFSLMQQFLDSQARLANLWSGNGAGQPQPAAEVPGVAANAEAVNRWSLLGQITFQNGDELHTERSFTLAHDHFLLHHTLGSAPSRRDAALTALPVIPFTFSMEIIAQAAARLAGGRKVVASMSNLRGYRWLTLDQDALVLRIRAKRATAGGDAVQVRVFQAGAERDVLVFEGQVQLAAGFSPKAPALEALSGPRPSSIADDQLYSTGMFHGPMLQGVKHITQWSAQGIEAQLEVLPTTGFFAEGAPPAFFTDAGLLDAAGQLVGYWLTEQYGSDFNCFPFHVGRFEQFAEPPVAGERVLCRGLIAFESETQIRADFEMFTSDGRLLARLESWQDRYFTIPKRFYEIRLNPQAAFLSRPWRTESGHLLQRVDPFPDHFLEDAWGIWARVLAHVVLSRSERRRWYALPERGPRRVDWLLGRIAAKDAVRQWLRTNTGVLPAPADVEIATTERGKPYVPAQRGQALAMPEISIAHTGGCAMALVSGEGAVGLDFEALDRNHIGDLRAGAFDAQELALAEAAAPERRDAMVIGLWCAKEAAAKASGLGLEGSPKRWRIVRLDRNGYTEVEHNGSRYPCQLWFGDGEVLAVCTVPGEKSARMAI